MRAQLGRQDGGAEIFKETALGNDVANVGKIVKRAVAGLSNSAAMQGSAEFLAPLIETRPLSLRPPLIRNLSR